MTPIQKSGVIGIGKQEIRLRGVRDYRICALVFSLGSDSDLDSGSGASIVPGGRGAGATSDVACAWFDPASNGPCRVLLRVLAPMPSYVQRLDRDLSNGPLDGRSGFTRHIQLSIGPGGHRRRGSVMGKSRFPLQIP